MRLSTILLAGGLVAGSATGAPAADMTLRFNLWVPPTHHTHKDMMLPWSKEVERVTEGRVKVQFTSSSLGPPPRQFDLAVSGIADITFGDHAYSPGRFFMTKMAELPFSGDNAEALSVAHWRVYSKLPQANEEHKGTKLLSVFNHGPAGFMSTKKAIDSVDAIKGMKIRVPGEIASKVVSRLGGVPVSGTIGQVFEMLAQGVVDGSTFNIDGYKNFRLDRFMKFVTTVPGGLYNVSFFLVMNEKKWAAISAKDQAAIMSVSGETFARKAGQVWDREDALAIELMKTKGVKITNMDGPFLAAVKERLLPLREEWIKEARSKGVDGAAVLADLEREYQKVYQNLKNR